MSKRWIVLMLTLCISFACLPTQQATAQLGIAEVIRAGVKRVIRAVDLRIQRLQNRTIWLQNVQKTLENKLSELKLEQIASWTARQRDQYQVYYDGLTQVKGIIAQYQRIREVINRQALLVKEYGRVWSLLQKDTRFRAEELQYMGKVYEGILDASLHNIEQIASVIQSYSLKMEDADRVALIQQLATGVEQNYHDLRTFNQQNITLSIQRGKSVQEVQTLKKLYGVK
ncbi:conjugal transfer protein TraI [Sphingobacterium corticis]|uniref:Conjugal transfer protein TraI n=1 Tax=Sphingobacterium corticis TaxID=1812823 RepID=A0ABW5NKB1_9SPHI